MILPTLGGLGLTVTYSKTPHQTIAAGFNLDYLGQYILISHFATIMNKH